ncbi:activin-like protein [Saccoglossus kowalevskii]|uniref:Activin-like protein n=1 Tax=Saccoglossus kowalevskii TaxID=10224 RepID=D1LWV4_SACKO|nr:activin-like protein [Saccoglossus kowalevskii]ACY92460.1 activin-like protein [Saccoglossus kowalevskii]
MSLPYRLFSIMKYSIFCVAVIFFLAQHLSFTCESALIPSKEIADRNTEESDLTLQQLLVLEKFRNDSITEGGEPVLVREGNIGDILADLEALPPHFTPGIDGQLPISADEIHKSKLPDKLGAGGDSEDIIDTIVEGKSGGPGKSSVGSDQPCTECKSTMQKQLIIKEGGEQLLDQLRLEHIKQLILSKLRLSEPPKLQKTSLPEPLSSGRLLTQEDYDEEGAVNIDDFYGKTTQVIVFAEKSNVACHSKSPEGCFEFKLTPEIFTSAVNSAQLWVYKLPAETNDTPDPYIVISKLASPNTLTTKEVARRQTSVAGGWLDFNVKHAVRKWQIHGNAEHALIARCENCPVEKGKLSPIATDEDRRPFIVINTSERHPRRKRSFDCTESISICCRKSFYVSFEDIHWNDWIIEPSGFYANHCNGSCEGNTLPRYQHTTMMQRVSRLYSRHNSQRPSDLTPCCTPTAMSGITLLYYNSTGYIIKKNLPNMSVESCGCS